MGILESYNLHIINNINFSHNHLEVENSTLVVKESAITEGEGGWPSYFPRVVDFLNNSSLTFNEVSEKSVAELLDRLHRYNNDLEKKTGGVVRKAELQMVKYLLSLHHPVLKLNEQELLALLNVQADLKAFNSQSLLQVATFLAELKSHADQQIFYLRLTEENHWNKIIPLEKNEIEDLVKLSKQLQPILAISDEVKVILTLLNIPRKFRKEIVDAIAMLKEMGTIYPFPMINDLTKLKTEQPELDLKKLIEQATPLLQLDYSHCFGILNKLSIESDIPSLVDGIGSIINEKAWSEMKKSIDYDNSNIVEIIDIYKSIPIKDRLLAITDAEDIIRQTNKAFKESLSFYDAKGLFNLISLNYRLKREGKKDVVEWTLKFIPYVMYQIEEIADLFMQWSNKDRQAYLPLYLRILDPLLVRDPQDLNGLFELMKTFSPDELNDLIENSDQLLKSLPTLTRRLELIIALRQLDPHKRLETIKINLLFLEKSNYGSLFDPAFDLKEAEEFIVNSQSLLNQIYNAKERLNVFAALFKFKDTTDCLKWASLFHTHLHFDLDQVINEMMTLSGQERQDYLPLVLKFLDGITKEVGYEFLLQFKNKYPKEDLQSFPDIGFSLLKICTLISLRTACLDAIISLKMDPKELENVIENVLLVLKDSKLHTDSSTSLMQIIKEIGAIAIEERSDAVKSYLPLLYSFPSAIERNTLLQDVGSKNLSYLSKASPALISLLQLNFNQNEKMKLLKELAKIKDPNEVKDLVEKALMIIEKSHFPFTFSGLPELIFVLSDMTTEERERLVQDALSFLHTISFAETRSEMVPILRRMTKEEILDIQEQLELYPPEKQLNLLKAVSFKPPSERKPFLKEMLTELDSPNISGSTSMRLFGLLPVISLPKFPRAISR